MATSNSIRTTQSGLRQFLGILKKSKNITIHCPKYGTALNMTDKLAIFR